MTYTYTHVKEKDFSVGTAKVNQLASEGWKLVTVTTRGGSYNFILEKEVE